MIVMSQETINQRITEFIKATSNVVFKTYPYGTCARDTNHKSLQSLETKDIPNSHHLIPKNKHPYYELVDKLLLHPTSIDASIGKTRICIECLGHLKKTACHP